VDLVTALRSKLNEKDEERRQNGYAVDDNQRLHRVLHALVRCVQVDEVVEEEEEGEVQLDPLEVCDEAAIASRDGSLVFRIVGLDMCVERCAHTRPEA